jgi:ankyrin repeat protein
VKKPFLILSLIFAFKGSSVLAQNIFEAARSGDVSRIEFLISIKPDTIHKINENGFTPLIIACYRDQKKVVELLLNKGVDVNYNSPEGSALIGTCYKGNTEIANMLLGYKANMDAQNEQGTTALIFAVQTNNLALVSLLIASGARKEMKEKSGRTAFDYARENKNQEIMDLLSK